MFALIKPSKQTPIARRQSDTENIQLVSVTAASDTLRTPLGPTIAFCC